MGLLLLAAGCAHHRHDAAPADASPEVQAAHVMPQPAKNRVHVAFIGGAVDVAGLGQLRAEVIDLGFIKTYGGQVGHKGGFLAAFEAARRREPDARFVLVAAGSGAGLAGELARQLEADGAAVDAVMVLDPVGRPAHAGRVVCLTTKGAALDGAENYQLDAGPLGIGKHPAARAVLLRELTQAASRVSVMDAG
ncbi:MAG: hypothetical protein ACRC33_08195, partial [Gemmataceae bacterium]